jgi:hypothetical protein
MERRVKAWRRWHNGYGDLVVQLNVEDTRLGVAEYCVRELGVQTIELKWGQGAKCIGGEIKVESLEGALQLQGRGYLVTPDPSLPAVQKAFKDGEVACFERHSRLGFVDNEGFVKEVERLRGLGVSRATLKTGAYGARELAMALAWSGEDNPFIEMHQGQRLLLFCAVLNVLGGEIIVLLARRDRPDDVITRNNALQDAVQGRYSRRESSSRRLGPVEGQSLLGYERHCRVLFCNLHAVQQPDGFIPCS